MQQKFFSSLSALGFHKVAYTQWGLPSEKPNVVCVHGLTRNGRDFDPLASALGQNRHVYCPDVVGRGKSGWLADATLYNYPQYLTDMTMMLALATRDGHPQVDWVGTSMGGIIGMLLAAQANSPLRRLVINDVGPFIPMVALKRIADYVSMVVEFTDMDQLERHLRLIYAPFGITRDADWKNLTNNSFRTLANGKLALAHDPAIAKNFAALDKDVDFWPVYDAIQCPVLLIRGSQSDILTHETAEQMTRRGPKAKLVEIANVGHAPALMDSEQIKVIADFLA